MSINFSEQRFNQLLNESNTVIAFAEILPSKTRFQDVMGDNGISLAERLTSLRNRLRVVLSDIQEQLGASHPLSREYSQRFKQIDREFQVFFQQQQPLSKQLVLTIPSETQKECFSFLALKDLAAVNTTCHLWNQLSPDVVDLQWMGMVDALDQATLVAKRLGLEPLHTWCAHQKLENLLKTPPKPTPITSLVTAQYNDIRTKKRKIDDRKTLRSLPRNSYYEKTPARIINFFVTRWIKQPNLDPSLLEMDIHLLLQDRGVSLGNFRNIFTHSIAIIKSIIEMRAIVSIQERTNYAENLLEHLFKSNKALAAEIAYLITHYSGRLGETHLTDFLQHKVISLFSERRMLDGFDLANAIPFDDQMAFLTEQAIAMLNSDRNKDARCIMDEVIDTADENFISTLHLEVASFYMEKNNTEEFLNSLSEVASPIPDFQTARQNLLLRYHQQLLDQGLIAEAEQVAHHIFDSPLA